LSIDPDVVETNQPYVFTGDNPLNEEDPLGTGSMTGKSGDLPTKGKYPYEPPKSGHGEPVKNPQGRGWKDKDGDIWTWDPKKSEWDVVNPRSNLHVNVNTEGEITHGKDTLPTKPFPKEGGGSDDDSGSGSDFGDVGGLGLIFGIFPSVCGQGGLLEQAPGPPCHPYKLA
jgi:hypothetical protein